VGIGRLGVRTLGDAADEIMVIAPSLPARLDWITSDTDRATQRADERLQTVLGQLGELGARASARWAPTTRCWPSRTRCARSHLITF
jgi:hypothetical protein